MKESIKAKWLISWRIVVAIGMVSVLGLTVMFGYLFYIHEIKNGESSTKIEESEYSNSYVFEYKSDYVRLKDVNTDKYLTPKLTRVFTENLKDSITVFIQNHKRGFLNIYTGKIVIPAQFDLAWVFSEGLGAVVMGGKIGFINVKGGFAIPCQFKYSRNDETKVDFLFKDGYCTVIDDKGKHGLIDKSGKWIVEPQYDYITNPFNGYRMVRVGTCYGLFDKKLNLVFEPQYDYMQLLDNGVIVIKNYHQQLIAYDGETILQPFVFDEIDDITYLTDRIGEDGEFLKAKCDLRYYRVSDRYGLIDKDGRKITEPLYRYIRGLSKDQIICQISDAEQILVDSKGKLIQ